MIDDRDAAKLGAIAATTTASSALLPCQQRPTQGLHARAWRVPDSDGETPTSHLASQSVSAGTAN